MTRRHAAAVTLLLSLATLGAQGPAPPPAGEWRAYHGDNRSLRYSPLDQITRANVGTLKLAWERDFGQIGPKPEAKNEAAPLYVDGTLYMTAGINRDVVALDPATGAVRWQWTLDEGERTARAPRRNSGRGVSYWRDGADARIVVVTPGFRLVSLDARTGRPVPSFGSDGMVDLKRNLGRGDFDPLAPIGSSSPVVIANGVIVVGPALELGFRPRTMANVPGYIRGFDVRTGKELWRFNTIPQAGEKYLDTWERDSWKYTGNAGVWAPFSADETLGYVYLPVEAPTGDLVRRASPRRQRLLVEPGLPGRPQRQGHLALPADPPRHLGLRQHHRADAARRAHRRPHGQGGGAGDQAGLHLRLRSRDRPAGLADRRAAGAGQRRSRRAGREDPAVPVEAAGLRSTGSDARRRRRLHARGPSPRRRGAEGLPARRDVPAAVAGGRARRQQGHHPPARRAGRGAVGARRRRSRDRAALRRLGDAAVAGRAREERRVGHGLRRRAAARRADGGRAADRQAAVRANHGHRPEERRDCLAGGQRRHAAGGSRSSAAEGRRPAADRQPIARRAAGDADAAVRRRGLGRPAVLPRPRQGDRRDRVGDAAARGADRPAHDLSASGPAVRRLHRRRSGPRHRRRLIAFALP